MEMSTNAAMVMRAAATSSFFFSMAISWCSFSVSAVNLSMISFERMFILLCSSESFCCCSCSVSSKALR